MPNFTTEDLLLYMYNEMEPNKATNLESAFESDWALKQKYQVLIEAQERLFNTKLLSPRSQTINAILRYAKANLHVSN